MKIKARKARMGKCVCNTEKVLRYRCVVCRAKICQGCYRVGRICSQCYWEAVERS